MILISLLILASAFDLVSTFMVCDIWHCEENPFLSSMWYYFGDAGLIAGKVLATGLIIFVIQLLRYRTGRIVAYSGMILANIVVGLTNLGYLPYYLLDWMY